MKNLFYKLFSIAILCIDIFQLRSQELQPVAIINPPVQSSAIPVVTPQATTAPTNIAPTAAPATTLTNFEQQIGPLSADLLKIKTEIIGITANTENRLNFHERTLQELAGRIAQLEQSLNNYNATANTRIQALPIVRIP